MVVEALLISLLFLFASGFSAVTGFGMSTIAIPVLLFFFPLPQTILFVGCMRFTASLCKFLMFRDRFVWELIVLIGLPAVIASFFGAHSLLLYESYISLRLIGFLLLVYVLFILLKPYFKLSEKSIVAMGGGILSGFSAGTFGTSGPILSAFLSAFDLHKITYIFTIAIFDFLIDTTRILTYVTGGIKLGPIFLLGGLFAIPAIFVGTWAARSILSRIPQQYFRFVIMVFLAVVGFRWVIWG